MDNLRNLTSHQSALVVLSFLQADCSNAVLREAVVSLGNDLTRDICGDLECDSCDPISGSIDGILPSVDLRWQEDLVEDAAIQEVAANLRHTADQFQQCVVVQATNNLSRNISRSPCENWTQHLSLEVENALRQGVCLEHLPQERVIVALSLTLVKGVCERVPQLLRDLFDTALRYISPHF
ncbi:BH3 interacting domain death agonist isoform 1-T2 [Aulostomus maculatus]